MSTQQFNHESQSLLALNDIEFLQEIVKRYPEAKMLAGPAESSPEGNQELKDTAIAYQVFDETTSVHQTAIEADRTFLSLILLKAALNDDRSKFPKLSDANWQGLVDLTNDIVSNEKDLELVLYSLTAQDLGKTQELVDAYKKEFGKVPVDHDKLLHNLTFERPELFSGYENRLSARDHETYLSGLAADLNLGQFVQGENLPCNLTKMMHTDKHSRQIRLLTELYDFAGVTGHVVHDKSILMDDNNYTAFSSAIEALNANDSVTAYTSYISKRGQLAGLVSADDDLTTDPEKFSLSRIATLSRVFTPEIGKQIKAVWDELPKEDRATLTQEMSITGMNADGPKGILLYYSPAVIANAIKAKGDFSEGLSLSLQALAGTYRSVRPHIDKPSLGKIVGQAWETFQAAFRRPASFDEIAPEGQVTVNINNLAKLASTNPDAIVRPASVKAQAQGQLFTLEV